jgi:hypothetical protein
MVIPKISVTSIKCVEDHGYDNVLSGQGYQTPQEAMSREYGAMLK